MTRSEWVPDVSNRALGGYDCCARHEGCLEHFALVAGRRERWYSLSPCARAYSTPRSMLERLTRAGRVPQVCIGCAILATRKRWARRCGRRGSGRGPRRARLQLPRRTRATLRWRSPSRTGTRPQTYSWLWRPTPRPGQPELTGSEGMIRSALAAARTCDPPSRPAWPQAGRVRPLRVRVLAERL